MTLKAIELPELEVSEGFDCDFDFIHFTHPKKGKVYDNSYGTLPDA